MWLSRVLHFVGEVLAGGWWRKWTSVLLIKIDRFFDDLAQFFKYLFLVVAVAAAEHKAWGAADVAAVLFGPFDDLRVARAVCHFFTIAPSSRRRAT